MRSRGGEQTGVIWGCRGAARAGAGCGRGRPGWERRFCRFQPQNPCLAGGVVVLRSEKGGRGMGTCGTTLPPFSRSSEPDLFFFLYIILIFVFHLISFCLVGLVLFSALSPPAPWDSFVPGWERPLRVRPAERHFSRVRDTGKASLPVPLPAGRTRPGRLHPRGQKIRGKSNPPARISSIRGETGVSAGTAAFPGARPLCTGRGHEWHRPRRDERGRQSRGCFPGGLQGPGRGHGPGAGSWARAAVPQPGEARAGAAGCVCPPRPRAAVTGSVSPARREGAGRLMGSQ